MNDATNLQTCAANVGYLFDLSETEAVNRLFLCAMYRAGTPVEEARKIFNCLSGSEHIIIEKLTPPWNSFFTQVHTAPDYSGDIQSA